METYYNIKAVSALGFLLNTNRICAVYPSYSCDHATQAKALALKAHEGIYYQPENIPYTTHLHKVVQCLHQFYEGSFDLNFASAVGWLHDVVEDTAITINDLHALFPNQICLGVSALTKNKQLSKADQMADSIDRILTQPKEVALVKISDRIANLSNPQLCWTIEKKQYYLNEASFILDKLAFAGKKMAQQLENAMINYENKFSQVINKV